MVEIITYNCGCTYEDISLSQLKKHFTSIKFHRKRPENGEQGAAPSAFNKEHRQKTLEMFKVNAILALFLLFLEKFLFGLRARRNVLSSVSLCQEMSGFSCHPEECNPKAGNCSAEWKLLP